MERGRVPTVRFARRQRPYSPQSEALKVFFGAFGTFTKYLNPVSFSRSEIDIRSLAVSLWFFPFCLAAVSWRST